MGVYAQDSIRQIASITKVHIAAVLYALHEKGKVNMERKRRVNNESAYSKVGLRKKRYHFFTASYASHAYPQRQHLCRSSR